jgi:hypothetical protein
VAKSQLTVHRAGVECFLCSDETSLLRLQDSIPWVYHVKHGAWKGRSGVCISKDPSCGSGTFRQPGIFSGRGKLFFEALIRTLPLELGCDCVVTLLKTACHGSSCDHAAAFVASALVLVSCQCFPTRSLLPRAESWRAMDQDAIWTAADAPLGTNVMVCSHRL